MCENSVKESTDDGCVFDAGVCCSIWSKGSTDIPRRAVVELKFPRLASIAEPNGVRSVAAGFTFEILKIALGFSLEMKPNSCHTTSLVGVGKPKYIDPPNPSAKGISPVRNTTMWLIPSICSSVK